MLTWHLIIKRIVRLALSLLWGLCTKGTCLSSSSHLQPLSVPFAASSSILLSSTRLPTWRNILGALLWIWKCSTGWAAMLCSCHRLMRFYPPGLNTQLGLDFGGLATNMEGSHRPGHFDGVAQVVKRLLDIVSPDKLFMGQKDYQQFRIIQHMAQHLEIPTEVIMCPIIREKSGLAMSSRNKRLSQEQKKNAAIIFQTLQQASKWMNHYSPRETRQLALEKLDVPGFRPEYFELADGQSLQPVQDWKTPASIVACTAVWAGNVRLIDNLILKG